MRPRKRPHANNLYYENEIDDSYDESSVCLSAHPTKRKGYWFEYRGGRPGVLYGWTTLLGQWLRVGMGTRQLGRSS